MNKYEKLVKAAENKLGLISALYCTSKGYSVKRWRDGKWFVLPFSFLNDAAGLGTENISLL